MLALANVGDSRAYLFSGGDITQVTDDHSLAEERMRQGEMTEEEAAVHPQRHILTRALGVSSQVDADMWELELRTGDRLLLCSDGLSNEVGSNEIAAILGEIDDPAEAAQRLVDAANGHGGADNITVVVVDVQVGEEGDGDGLQGDAPQPRCGRPRRSPGHTAAVPVVESLPGGDIDPPESGPESATPPLPGFADGVRLAAPDATAIVPAVGPDETLAPGSRLVFGDEPATLAETGPRSDEFFVGAARRRVSRWPARRHGCHRLRSGGRATSRRARRTGVPGGASGYSTPHHAAGDRLHPSGGRRPGGRLLRPQVVRLRQLGRDGAG